MTDFSTGDIARRKDGRELRSGMSAYAAAIVVSVDPFVLASHDGDMRWESTVSADDFSNEGPAPIKLTKAAMRRVES